MESGVFSHLLHLAGVGRNAYLLRRFFIIASINILGAALVFCVQIVIARLLGVSSYGNYIYIFTWMSILAMFALFGFNTASVRFVAVYSINKEWERLLGFIKYSRRFVFKSSIFIMTMIFIAAWVLKDTVSAELFYTLLVGCLAVPAISFMNLSAGMLNGFKEVIKASAFVNILTPLILLVLLYVVSAMPYVSLSAGTVMMVRVLSFAATSAIIMWQLKRFITPMTGHGEYQYEFTKWFKASRDLLLTSCFALIFIQGDILIVGAMLGTKDAGIYAVASRLAGLLVFLLVAVNAILSPIVAEHYAQREMHKLQGIYTLSVRMIVLFSLIVGVVLFVWGDIFLSLFGDEFIVAFPILKILILGQLANASVGSVGVLINMTGNQFDGARILALAAVMNIFLNWALIKLMGINGAAIATAIMFCLVNAAFALLVWKRLGIVALPIKIPKRMPV